MKVGTDFITRIVKRSQNRYDLEVNLGMSTLSSMSENDVRVLIEHLERLLNKDTYACYDSAYYFPAVRETE